MNSLFPFPRNLLLNSSSSPKFLGGRTTVNGDGPVTAYHTRSTQDDLPTEEWHLIANGHTRSLDVESVDANGRVKAIMQNTFEVNGFWDERARRMTFQRTIEEKASPGENNPKSAI